MNDFTFRPVVPAEDAPLLHAWVTHPKAVFWMMQNTDVSDVEREYAQLEAYLGLYNGAPEFLFEKYDPRRSELAGRYQAAPGDVGMHFLTAPTDTPVHGFTRGVLVAVIEFLFADPATQRVVVEPDVRNTAVHRLNAAVGFRIEHELTLGAKRAYLSTCSRTQFLERDR